MSSVSKWGLWSGAALHLTIMEAVLESCIECQVPIKQLVSHPASDSLIINALVLRVFELDCRSTTVKNFNSSFRTGILFVRKVCRLSVCCFSGTKSGHAWRLLRFTCNWILISDAFRMAIKVRPTFILFLKNVT